MLSLILLLSCEEAKEPTEPPPTQPPEEEWNETSTICGTIELSADCSTEPETVNVWTVLNDATACSENDGMDTGWEDWRDTLIAELEVSDGKFESDLDAGTYAISTNTSQGCSGCMTVEITDDSCTEITLTTEMLATVDAPNIYLYPEEKTAVHVQVAEPERIIKSDPIYPRGGWWSLAHPDGQLLTKSGWKDFLFYESLIDSKRFQREEGWCVAGERGQLSIEASMEDYGFLPNEIRDFSDFWDSEFPKSDWITVYPQQENLLPVGIFPRPDSFLRVWFVVEDGCHRVVEPEIPAVKRTGYHASEWGVMMIGNLEGPTVITGLEF